MASLSLARSFDRARAERLADWLVLALAVSLPWSTSATGILAALWAIVLIPTLDWPEMRRTLLTAAAGLPVLLLLLGIAGMFWADVSWAERWGGLGSFLKLLALPLLLVQFARSRASVPVFAAYLASCIGILVVSFAYAALGVPTGPDVFNYGVPVKNAPTQSGEFITCIAGIAFIALTWIRQGKWAWAAAALAVAAAMLVNIVFIATGRTALVTLVVLLALFGIRQLSRRGATALFLAATALAAILWVSSPFLRGRVESTWIEFKRYEATDARNSSGERVEFARRSIEFIRAAPIVGNGTGSIHSLFQKAAEGQSGAQGVASSNPHNQTFAVGIQLGLVGIAVLWAMWIAHLLLFRGPGLAAWIGLVVVVQNIVGSAFNSHLFDFVQGWTYVVGVGVAGGMVLRARAQKSA